MKDVLREIVTMDKELIFTKDTLLDIMEHLEMNYHMDMERLYMPVEINMMAIGQMVALMDKVRCI